MKICMGDKTSHEEIGSIQPFFGYPFVVQKDRTLMCEVPEELEAVAAISLKTGQVELWSPRPVDLDESNDKAAETFEKYVEPEKPKPKPKPKGRPPAKPAAKKEPEKEIEKDPEPDKKE